MIAEKTYQESGSIALTLQEKLRNYGQLVKFRLTMLVVFSTFAGFMLATPFHIEWVKLWILLAGGFMTVGAANGINQIIERSSDRQMKRTENRPLAQNRISVAEAAVFCTMLGIGGVMLIGLFLNEISGLLAFVSLLIYGFFYTPLKKYSPLAVFVGAIPGALPPMIGYVAITGHIDAMAIALFMIQFIWQFPHFWAIAWVLHEDYMRAGFNLLPLGGGKTKQGALQIVMFSLVIIPISLLPLKLGEMGLFSAVIAIVCGVMLVYQSINLFRHLDNKAAKKLMFGSFIYVPIVFIAMIIDKFFF